MIPAGPVLASVGFTLAIGAGAVSPAHAINECGPAIGGVVTCNTSTYPKGPGTHIEYRIDTGLRATIDSVAVRWADDAGSDRPAIDIRSDKVTSEGDLIVTMEGSTVTTGEPDRIGTRSDREVGEYADGLRVTQRGAGLVSATMLSGSIITYGYNAAGIYAWQPGANENNKSDVIADFSGEDSTIETFGSYSQGIYGRTETGIGNVAVTAKDGTIVTHGLSSIGVRGLKHSASLGDGDVTVAGDNITVTTGGNLSIGMEARVEDSKSGRGNASVFVRNEAAIETSGTRAHGAQAFNLDPGDSTVVLEKSKITTRGEGAIGIRAEAGDGNAVTEVTKGSIATAGASAIGLAAISQGNMGEARVSLDGGDVSTGGDNAEGLIATAKGAGGTATARLVDGNVKTAGRDAEGLIAHAGDESIPTSINADASVIMQAGSITTTGDGAGGMIAETDIGPTPSTGKATAVQRAGTIMTSGGEIGGNEGSYAIAALSFGSGLASIEQAGGSATTAGAQSHALYALSIFGNTMVTQAAGSSAVATGAKASGLRALAGPGGGNEVTLDGKVTAGSAPAVHTIGSAGSKITIGSAAEIDGSASGTAIRDGDSDLDAADETGGNSTATLAGKVTGDVVMGLGNDIINLTGGVLDGDVYGDDRSASAADGDDSFTWSGGTWLSSFFGGNGSDTATASAQSYDGTHHYLDGGDDVSTADGWTDRLTLSGVTASANGANIVNWEIVTLDAADLTILDGALEAGSEPETGLFLTNGSVLNGSDAFALTGNMAINGTSQFIAFGEDIASGVYSISGNLVNAGTVDMQDGGTGDVLSVGGNYTGAENSTVYIDTYLGDDASPTDRITVGGDTAGSTAISIGNASGPSAQTVAGIRVVDVAGASSGTFVLANANSEIKETGEAAITRGAYAYALRQVDNDDWFLQSTLAEDDTGPDTGGEQAVDPETEGGETVDPGTGGGETVDPGTGGGETVDPGTGGGETVDPGTGGGETVDPGTGGGETVDPGTGGGETVDPGTGGGETVDPGTGGGETVDPGTGGGETVIPSYNQGVPVYETYARNLLGFIQLPTLRRRASGERVPALRSCGSVPLNVEGNQTAVCAEDNTVWARIDGTRAHVEPEESGARVSEYDSRSWLLQAGIDALLHSSGKGELIGGLTAHYGGINTDVSSFYGDGSIDTRGYGLGATLTWYGQNGFYLDGQGQLTRFDSDLDSDILGRLADGNDGLGYAVSIEAGHRIGLGDTWALTPQAQLVYTSVNFDDFVDPYGARVSLDDGNSLRGRIGLALDREQQWQGAEGDGRSSRLYGTIDLYREFLGDTRADVSGVSFGIEADDWIGEIGIGGSYNWGDDKYSLYGEARASTGLSDFGGSYAVRASVGLKMKF
ncbi:autotransporter outer membrane beta-barrel domain-containing protein [Sinorhizobium meliloti]|uniref:autotransporter outer membrane beta-barrel domain-containing protein n=5 Tax=Rhizobium meliloti TaxID=382 RepID=UPI000FDBC789|nr:autotransporter outer membrane beta-barrel domain-containing protein [Sinorhizobium meliloti]MDW9545319.1 autotransporter outer membrane beta-barrel domain-containing protein [Sinorhizobium meliloti]MQW60356.1 autotransporter outer membrane beta-barrel domain-containing protein [Sinorhizobium meliloti]MQX44812.1 autotransporter outer membrane beta-barrel domain-containing protein [Sinorhizobium meliloti]MQX71279.1 autotransporter outer membrane beta-barrel domain-containing protein [Sinorhiz